MTPAQPRARVRLVTAIEDLRKAVALLVEREAQSSLVPRHDRLLSARDMCALIGCDLRTLRRWELDGEVPKSIMIGGTKRWRRPDVDRWLEAKQ